MNRKLRERKGRKKAYIYLTITRTTNPSPNPSHVEAKTTQQAQHSLGRVRQLEAPRAPLPPYLPLLLPLALALRLATLPYPVDPTSRDDYPNPIPNPSLHPALPLTLTPALVQG